MLIDANVLVYSIDEDAPQHPDSSAVIDAGLAGRLPAVVVPQVLLEFFATVTNSRRFNAPLSPEAAWLVVEMLQRGLKVLEVLPTVMGHLATLVQNRRPLGQTVFDAFLAAQVLSHGLGSICTYNTRHFSGIAGIEAITPEEALRRYGLAAGPP